MADLIKLFDFKPQNDYKNGLKNDFKATGLDKQNFQDKESISKDSGNSFSKALDAVSNAIQNKEPVKETVDNKSIQNPEKLEKTEKQAKDILIPIMNLIKQLKENPGFKKEVEKFEKILTIH